MSITKGLKERMLLFAVLFGVLGIYFCLRVLQPGSSSATLVGMDIGAIPSLIKINLQWNNVGRFSEWILMHANYSALSVGVVLLAASIIPLLEYHRDSIRKTDYALYSFSLIVLTSNFCFVLLASAVAFVYEQMFPPLYLCGRYVDPAIPGLVVIGITGLTKVRKGSSNYSHRILILTSLISISVLAFPMMWKLGQYTPLNPGISYLFGLSFPVIGLFLSTIILVSWSFLRIRIRGERLRYLAVISLIFFCVFSGLTAHNFAYGWATSSQGRANYEHELFVSRWTRENGVRDVTLLVDKNLQEDLWRIKYGLYFWRGDECIDVRFGDISRYKEAEYVLTSSVLGLPPATLYSGRGITYFIYRVPKDTSFVGPILSTAAMNVLLGVYESRPDLKNAYPSVTTEWSTQNALIRWAATYGIRTDSAQPQLGRYGYLYVLADVYNDRSDLQVAYPEVMNGNLRNIISWAAKYGITIDSARQRLGNYGHVYVLLNIYGNRIDLRAAYPQVENGDLTGIIDWAVRYGISTDSAKSTLEVYAPQLVLLWVYNLRHDLQQVMPAAFSYPMFQSLINWAAQYGVTIDSAKTTLQPYATWYQTFRS
jgi:hypothetical protein